MQQGDFYEALCKDVDPVKKELVCCFPADAGFDEACFKMTYDILVVSVSGRAWLASGGWGWREEGGAACWWCRWVGMPS